MKLYIKTICREFDVYFRYYYVCDANLDDSEFTGSGTSQDRLGIDVFTSEVEMQKSLNAELEEQILMVENRLQQLKEVRAQEFRKRVIFLEGQEDIA